MSRSHLAALVLDAGVTWPVPLVVGATGSTNDDLAALAAEGAPEGTCIVAEEQTAGRGRLDRVWASPPGAGLWTSVLVRAGDQPKTRWALLSLVAGVACADALRSACGLRADLKWPNDVVVVAAACGANVGYRKLGGILSQTTGDDAVVIGMGLNVSLGSDELPVPEATSVFLEGGRPDREALLVALLGALSVRLDQWRSGDPALLADYRASCRTIGRLVDVSMPDGSRLSGVVSDVDDAGHLLVADGDAIVTVTAGDVVHASL